MGILKKFLRVSADRRPDSRRALRLAEEAAENKTLGSLPGALSDGETTTHDDFTFQSKDGSFACSSAAGGSWQVGSEDGFKVTRTDTSFSEGLNSEDYGMTRTSSLKESPGDPGCPPPPSVGKKQNKIAAMRAMMRTVKTAAVNGASSVRGLRKTRIDVCPDFSDVVTCASPSFSP
eukprot:TRINITY_DN10297_c0_g3_i1.p1 TRINITY_DN10297_c0_g3~~TRINITY_DN10297_c0_g3_i1.p1  ORF type:complete len:176 (+),score=32.12 TRINITY_DN10297_c0_g3_i1:446-973(+)